MNDCNSYFTKGKQESYFSPIRDEWSSTSCIGTFSYVLIPKVNISSYELHDSLAQQFENYSLNWKNETRGYSTLLHKVRNDNFLDIISIGKPAIKFILEDLKKDSSFLFIALDHLVKIHMSQESPIKVEDTGNVKKIISLWIEWGKRNKIIQ